MYRIIFGAIRNILIFLYNSSWVCAIFIYLLYKINMASVCFKRNKWPWFILKASPLLSINSLRSSLFKNFFASKNYWNTLTCVLERLWRIDVVNPSWTYFGIYNGWIHLFVMQQGNLFLPYNFFLISIKKSSQFSLIS